MPHTFVAMSGGVDSSAAALLLSQAGHRVSGVHLHLLRNEDPDQETSPGSCCSQSDAEDAALVARKLGFPFYVFDFASLFRDTVIQDFIREYQLGRTPNPCAVCNRQIKFGALLDRVLALGGDYLATGHYARVQRCGDRFLLKRGLDPSKDQTYFLYALTQRQLSHTLFPLGELEKSQVRRLAEDAGLVNARKRDSQDICFVPGGGYASFIERAQGHPAPGGDFLDREGRVLGRHKGLIRYTLGQHKGLGLSTEEPLYVLEKDAASNTVRLGPGCALWSRVLTANQVNWISVPTLDAPMEVTVKTRHSQREAEALAELLPDGRLQVTFSQPQRAVTPGQAVVLYDGDTVVGGGVIDGSRT